MPTVIVGVVEALDPSTTSDRLAGAAVVASLSRCQERWSSAQVISGLAGVSRRDGVLVLVGRSRAAVLASAKSFSDPVAVLAFPDDGEGLTVAHQGRKCIALVPLAKGDEYLFRAVNEYGVTPAIEVLVEPAPKVKPAAPKPVKAKPTVGEA